MSGPLQEIFTADPLDQFIISQLLEPKEAAELSREKLEVLRAHIRSEILFSADIKKVLLAKAQDVLKALK
jgi:hypothetical protein